MAEVSVATEERQSASKYFCHSCCVYIEPISEVLYCFYWFGEYADCNLLESRISCEHITLWYGGPDYRQDCPNGNVFFTQRLAISRPCRGDTLHGSRWNLVNVRISETY